jgi:DNA-damage-inducible protein J
MNATDIVRARIDTETKSKATAALAAMGLSVSDAIRMLLLRVAEERKLPFDVSVPNSASRNAIAELDSDQGAHFGTADALFADLGI